MSLEDSLTRHLDRHRHVAPIPTVKPFEGTVAEFKNDIVNHPAHYTTHPEGVECIQITRYMNFNLGNVVKYLWREGLKNSTVPLDDLKKARWYLDDEIKLREKQNGN